MVSTEAKKKELIRVLKNYYHGDMTFVKLLVKDCEDIGLPIGENIDAIMEHNGAFETIIMLSDNGILRKLVETLDTIKGAKDGKQESN